MLNLYIITFKMFFLYKFSKKLKVHNSIFIFPKSAGGEIYLNWIKKNNNYKRTRERHISCHSDINRINRILLKLRLIWENVICFHFHISLLITKENVTRDSFDFYFQNFVYQSMKTISYTKLWNRKQNENKVTFLQLIVKTKI